eukprot:GFUD01009652.1.p1 GENE.GFUD01009652.1~~GFUD01009652.1.p1  ORF type:complete len:344 (+),score=61.97 GFUD01009652.1:51-1082(+)
MGGQDDIAFIPLTEEKSNIFLAEFMRSRQRNRTLQNVSVVVLLMAILAWCGYLTLIVKDGVSSTALDATKAEMNIIERIINQVVASQKPEAITAKVHIKEHGVDYQQTVSFNPQTQIVRVHNPHHLHLDESITLLHKPSGMQLMLNNNHKHCEYSSIPEGVDPELFAQSSKEMEESHTTMTMDMAEDVQIASIQTGTLSDHERDALHPEMQNLCAGLEIYQTKTVPLDHANQTMLEIPHDGGRFRRQASVTCAGGMADKCYPASTGWGQTCMWLICHHRLVEDGRCTSIAIHRGNAFFRCSLCCPTESSSAMCRCNQIHDNPSFVSCQQKACLFSTGGVSTSC